jgi:DNA-binding NarL/FixJ family response regulator
VTTRDGPVHVLVVDDQAIVRRGVRMVLDGEPDLEVVGEAVDGVAAVASAARLRPDLVLMDLRMPRMDGIEATRRIMATGSAVRVLVLTTFDHDEYVFGALRAGASGYLLKDAEPDQILAALRTVAAGDALVAPSLTRRLIEAATGDQPVRHPHHPLRAAVEDGLTTREKEILLRLAEGSTNAQIAAALHISEPTTKTHVSHLLAKLGLRSRVQAVILAYEIGMIVPGRLPLTRLRPPAGPIG